MRFYGIDPDRFFELPIFQLDILARQMPALDAGDQLTGIDIATAPHLKRSDYREKIRQLRNVAFTEARPIAQPMEKEEINPAKAEEWFASMGMRIKTKEHA
ncbi:hypothetical protein [Herpetosiphon geysericola]|uniref:Uncharacterized protein n=1 Tax=Herpetosiphon geysericola TaxID=70996 RepID=A0A0P6YA09_9CHLR|nr:hypothetical protein [Herpetosiphon geysericola]KPL89997.1 hypothetical protein SE18_08565 [Herpetosiphon geysericola]